MKRLIALCAVAGLATLPSMAVAEDAQDNVLLVASADTALNQLLLTVDGSGNGLFIEQVSAVGATAANSMDIDIRGDGNGGSMSGPFTGALSETSLRPGLLMQSGQDNLMAVSVVGSGNLFAFSQTGDSNVALASIVGENNQASVMQVGNGNIASFSQNGSGNSISLRQTSW